MKAFVCCLKQTLFAPPALCMVCIVTQLGQAQLFFDLESRFFRSSSSLGVNQGIPSNCLAIFRETVISNTSQTLKSYLERRIIL